MSRDTTPDMSRQPVRHDPIGSDHTRDDSTFVLACRELSPGWTSKELANLMRRDQRTAQRRIAQWIERGWVRELTDDPGRYEVNITEVRS